MTDKTYNGWTNYATWRVNIEIFDGLEIAEMFDLTLSAWDLGQVLQDYAEEVVTMSVRDPEAPSLALAYAMTFLQGVNWYEIAEHMIEDYAEENQEIDLDDGLSAVNEQQE
jgi:hypothetical protein